MQTNNKIDIYISCNRIAALPAHWMDNTSAITGSAFEDYICETSLQTYPKDITISKKSKELQQLTSNRNDLLQQAWSAAFPSNPSHNTCHQPYTNAHKHFRMSNY